jgi:hypothetical protein
MAERRGFFSNAEPRPFRIGPPGRVGSRVHLQSPLGKVLPNVGYPYIFFSRRVAHGLGLILFARCEDTTAERYSKMI